jgi:hypothetical protein
MSHIKFQRVDETPYLPWNILSLAGVDLVPRELDEDLFEARPGDSEVHDKLAAAWWD